MPDLHLQTHTKHFNRTLRLESGRILEPFWLRYETYGRLNAQKDNAVVVCHALTGSHHAAGQYAGEKKSGWWDGLIGAGKAIDTDKFFVICVNVIGSSFGSSSPQSLRSEDGKPYRLKFPVITIKDMVQAQMELFIALGIEHARAVIGGSMGGMQALHFAVDYPHFADDVIALATTHATPAWTIAFNKAAVEAIKNDPAFKGGEYNAADIAQNGLRGAAIARMIGHISFLSPGSMDSKFGREYLRQDGLFDLNGRFQVDSYLDYNGDNFARWFDPLSFIYIAKAVNIYDISRGFESLRGALAQVEARVHLFSFSADLLFLPRQMQEIKTVLDDLAKPCFYREVESDYGHDAFLVEIEKYADDVERILNGR